jgi:hypothetical protein
MSTTTPASVYTPEKWCKCPKGVFVSHSERFCVIKKNRKPFALLLRVSGYISTITD